MVPDQDASSLAEFEFLMTDNAAGIDIGKRFERQPAALLFLIDPGCEGLLDDPAPGPFEASRQLIHLFSERQRHMCRDDPGFHRPSQVIKPDQVERGRYSAASASRAA